MKGAEGTLRSHLESVWRQTKVKPKELADLPPMPPFLRQVFPIFVDLSLTRDYEQGVPLPIKNREILAWAELRSRKLTDFTLRMLKILDAAWLKVMNKART